MRILAIDDEKEILTVIGRTLTEAGHDVTLATGARVGRDKLETGDYEFLITEVFMPAMAGLDLIRTARRRQPDLRIIAMSGSGAKIPANVSLMLSEAFGADRILFKPFRARELLAAIEETSDAT